MVSHENELLRKPIQWLLSSKLLAGIVVVGFLMRLSGIFWGMPLFDPYAQPYHPDEPKIIGGAYNFPGDIITRTDLRYPTACHYTLGLLVWPVKEMMTQHGQDPTWFIYLFGRLLSVCLGTATILLVYAIARSFYGTRCAIIASFLIAFSMLHVANSAWATTDVATSFFLTAFLFFLYKTRNSDMMSLLCGIALGLLIGAKYTGGIALIALGVFLLISAYQQQNRLTIGIPLRAMADRRLWIISATSIVVFLISTPGILVNTQAFLDSIESERNRMSHMSLPLWDPAVWKRQLFALFQSGGMPLAIVSILALFIGVRRNVTFHLPVLIMVLAFLLYFGSALLPRYIIMIMPLLAILSAALMERVLLFKPAIVSRVLVAGVLVFTLCYAGLGAWSRYPDTRTEAARYIDEHVERGTSIGLAYSSKEYGWQTHAWAFPKVNFSQHRYVDFLEEPQYVVVSSYDSVRIRKAFLDGIVSDQYEIPDSEKKRWYRMSPPSAEIFRFFEALYLAEKPPYRQIAAFDQPAYVDIEFPAPTIEVFKRDLTVAAD